MIKERGDKKTIAVDFDGVIHQYSKGWHDGTCYDKPIEGSFEALIELDRRGYNVVVFSTREPEQMKEWFFKWAYKIESIEGEEAPNIEFTNKKPPAIAYIDDRGIRFTNWKDILNYF
jgi:hypothetical protein